MGVNIEVIIEHEFSPEQLQFIAKEFQNIDIRSIEGNHLDWEWTRKNINDEFLIDYWNRKSNWYIQNEWSEQDLAIIRGPDHFSLHFYKPNFVAVTNWTRLGQFQSDEKLKELFKTNVKEIAKIFKSNKLIFMQEHGIAGLPHEVAENNYSSIQELIDLMKTGQWYYELLE